MDGQAPGTLTPLGRDIFLRQAGFPDGVRTEAARRAGLNGTDIFTEIVALADGHDERLYRAVARRCGLAFVDTLDPAALIVDSSDPDLPRRRVPFVHCLRPDAGAMLILAPPPAGIEHLLSAPLAHGVPHPGAPGRAAVATPRAVERAIEARTRGARLDAAVNGLATAAPHSSARFAFNGWQGWFLGTLLTAIPAAALLVPDLAEAAFHLSVTLFFLVCIILRLMALLAHPGPAGITPLAPFRRSALPRYAVLVAAYQEAAVAAQLVAAMRALKWPPSKLDILFVCEEGDTGTIDAINAARPGPHMRIVTVPPGGPKTKPKALMTVLPLVQAPFLVLYDAEDRPHPEQLLEAWQALEADPGLACVQAPLDITNGRRARLAALFAFEYATIFRGLLPYLSARRRYVPLGGTSNHFRTSDLRQSGGWDPYNVTEDADLGLRLHAQGRGIGMISRPTLEDAPERLAEWRNQRTRWLKGYMQTWMVSLRQPFTMTRRIGWKSMFVVQAMLGGIVLSSLVHPFALLFGAATVTAQALGAGSLSSGPLAVIDWTSLLAAYLVFFALGVSTLPVAERRRALWILPALPLYWLAISYCAWRAAIQIVGRPHLWEKTPHRPASEAENLLG